MSLIPYRPIWDIDKWFDDENWLEDWFERPRLGRVLRAFDSRGIKSPKVDVYEQGDSIVAEMEVPGVDPKNIDVEVKEDMLKIEAKTEEKKEDKKKGYYRKEISSGFYKRLIPLPVEVKGEKAEAIYQDGILKITIPKIESKKIDEKKGVKVKIKSKNS